MPIVEHAAETSASCVEAFDLSMSVGRRLQWDPFIGEQRFLHGATAPGVGVETWTRSRHRLTMTTRYLTFRRPDRIGMKMIDGPWFFRTFSGAWRFEPIEPGPSEHGPAGHGTHVWFRYNFTCRPSWLAPLAERIGRRYLGRDIRRRVGALVDALDAGMRALPEEVAAREATSQRG